MPVATHKTSSGCKYGQILSGQIYVGSRNTSTYQVNKSKRPLGPPVSQSQRKHRRASSDHDGIVNSTNYQANGSEEPVHERSAPRNLEKGEAECCQTVGSSDLTSACLVNNLLTDKQTNKNPTGERNDPGQAKPLTEAAALRSSPTKSITDDSLGLLRDLSQILSRGEATTLTAGASQVPVPEAEHRPRIRDFAANDSAPFSRARAAIRRRSRSPAKRENKQTEAPVTPDRALGAAANESDPLGRSSNSIILPPIAFKEPIGPPMALPLPMAQEQDLATNASPVINYRSKAPSVVSARSTAEEIQSDASSGVVTNAQSAIFVKVPPQPGPAPLTPLPSLPEGLDSFAPAIPGVSQWSQRCASPESFPPKAPPQKSPTRSQYKLYPSLDSSPSKRPGSPIRMKAATGPEQAMPRPSRPLHSMRRGTSVPQSDHLPTSMSVGSLDEVEQWRRERADNVGKKNPRDLARLRSHEATVEEVKPVTRDTAEREKSQEGVTKMPDPRDPYDSALFPFRYRPQPSQVSKLSATTTLQYLDSSALSQKLSPIIVVAEQEPFSLSQRAPSQRSQFSNNSIDENPRGFKTNGFYSVPPHLASPTLQGPENEGKIRPVSSHSLPVPQSVASRVPTPHRSPPLRVPPQRSSHHSSLYEMSGLEARLSAMERKNAMLERAFLAVLNTSTAIRDGLGVQGIVGTRVDSSIGSSGRGSDLSSRTSGTGSLYAGLENLLALHSDSAGARWSTSSGS